MRIVGGANPIVAAARCAHAALEAGALGMLRTGRHRTADAHVSGRQRSAPCQLSNCRGPFATPRRDRGSYVVGSSEIASSIYFPVVSRFAALTVKSYRGSDQMKRHFEQAVDRRTVILFADYWRLGERHVVSARRYDPRRLPYSRHVLADEWLQRFCCAGGQQQPSITATAPFESGAEYALEIVAIGGNGRLARSNRNRSSFSAESDVPSVLPLNPPHHLSKWAP